MIIERNVFQAKYGRGDELVQLLEEGRPTLAKYGMGSYRILTDLSGPFFTVEMETELESLAAFESTCEAFADPDFGDLVRPHDRARRLREPPLLHGRGVTPAAPASARRARSRP